MGGSDTGPYFSSPNTLLRFAVTLVLGEIDLPSLPRGITRFDAFMVLGLRFAGASTAISLSNSDSGMVNLSFSILGSSIGCVFRLSTSSSYSTGTPIISCRNFRNNRPCTGFVFTSAHMSLVPLCWIDKSPWATLSVIKKNLFLMCLLFLPADILPFFARRMINLLSWYRRLLSIVYPCASMKYLQHKIIPRTSAILTSSDSVELATFILCFLAMFTMASFPIDIIAPVCPFESRYTPKDPSTHHIMLDRLSAVKYLFMYRVPIQVHQTVSQLTPVILVWLFHSCSQERN